ncbi:helix-turn-helix domain-containing protein [Micromonospora thermarum]|uniref:Helix-turn-helix transcriptional regulator n=1 Tax=Micromonospora thermarum TaxID=2720024 RepID=A0ABX0ZEL0_9ACTN|nr:helix-turn-helix domain-containing protein [Micromonospora thermarum]NJP35632.1 helix-turn-helix transcriptional regulator [Micromonospora thermarum]
MDSHERVSQALECFLVRGHASFSLLPVPSVGVGKVDLLVLPVIPCSPNAREHVTRAERRDPAKASFSLRTPERDRPCGSKESQLPRTGRRPGTAETRAAILAAARNAFAARGYDGVSIRQVASGAAVDPALVHHYFGSKVGLFRTALRTAVDPEGLLSDLFAGDVDTLGQRPHQPTDRRAAHEWRR